MRSSQLKVQKFHEKHGYPVAESPRLVHIDLAEERAKFLREEVDEFLDAALAKNLTKVADGLADILYIALGTAVVYGIDIQAVFDEVHRSNMTKTPLDPVTHKGGKGEGYQPPRITEVLLKQMTGLDKVEGL